MINNRLTDRIKAYIIKCHPNDFLHLSVNEIARHFHISIPYLSRVFIKEQGINLKTFLLNEKITRSRFLLKQNQSLNVKEVAFILGFCSSNYFTRVFKKHVGVTPGKFRKMDRGFYGLDDRRKSQVDDRRFGLIDRRTGIERRKNKLYVKVDRLNLVYRNEDRRQRPVDRRIGLQDRRRLFTKLFV